jgi:hypothetical protein
MHLSTLSVNSMAGVPTAGNAEIGHDLWISRSVSLRTLFSRARAAKDLAAKLSLRKTMETETRRSRAGA